MHHDVVVGVVMSRLWPEKAFRAFWPVRAAKVFKGLSRLVRTREIGVTQATGLPCGVAHWHGDELALMPRFGHLGLSLLVSTSRDGDIMARAATALGYRVARGSSTRGAVGGLLALMKEMRQGRSVALAVDGPQGPRGVCKPGIVRLAQKAGVPLFPVGVATTNKYVFQKAWNRAYIPLPLSRQVIFVDAPLYFSGRFVPEEMESHCRTVEKALWAAQEKAQKALRDW